MDRPVIDDKPSNSRHSMDGMLLPRGKVKVWMFEARERLVVFSGYNSMYRSGKFNPKLSRSDLRLREIYLDPLRSGLSRGCRFNLSVFPSARNQLSCLSFPLVPPLLPYNGVDTLFQWTLPSFCYGPLRSTLILTTYPIPIVMCFDSGKAPTSYYSLNRSNNSLLSVL